MLLFEESCHFHLRIPRFMDGGMFVLIVADCWPLGMMFAAPLEQAKEANQKRTSPNHTYPYASRWIGKRRRVEKRECLHSFVWPAFIAAARLYVACPVHMARSHV